MGLPGWGGLSRVEALGYAQMGKRLRRLWGKLGAAGSQLGLAGPVGHWRSRAAVERQGDVQPAPLSLLCQGSCRIYQLQVGPTDGSVQIRVRQKQPGSCPRGSGCHLRVAVPRPALGEMWMGTQALLAGRSHLQAASWVPPRDHSHIRSGCDSDNRG